MKAIGLKPTKNSGGNCNVRKERNENKKEENY